MLFALSESILKVLKLCATLNPILLAAKAFVSTGSCSTARLTGTSLSTVASVESSILDRISIAAILEL